MGERDGDVMKAAGRADGDWWFFLDVAGEHVMLDDGNWMPVAFEATEGDWKLASERSYANALGRCTTAALRGVWFVPVAGAVFDAIVAGLHALGGEEVG